MGKSEEVDPAAVCLLAWALFWKEERAWWVHLRQRWVPTVKPPYFVAAWLWSSERLECLRKELRWCVGVNC